MEIRKINVKELNPALYNPRKDLSPGDPEYEKLKKSIEQFGYVEPLVWNQRTGNLIAGHQRLKILLQRRMKEVEVSVVDLDDKQEKALNIALNKIDGDWDSAKLKYLLESLDDGAFDMELTGFDEDELEDLMGRVYEPANIDDILDELDLSKSIEKPIWATVRTSAENQELLERTMALLKSNGIRVERSYD